MIKLVVKIFPSGHFAVINDAVTYEIHGQNLCYPHSCKIQRNVASKLTDNIIWSLREKETANYITSIFDQIKISKYMFSLLLKL